MLSDISGYYQTYGITRTKGYSRRKLSYEKSGGKTTENGEHQGFSTFSELLQDWDGWDFYLDSYPENNKTF